MRGFSWVIEGQLAGMPRPGRLRPLEADLAFLSGAGVRLLVTLTVDALPAASLAGHGIEGLHLPVPDFGVPDRVALPTFVDRAEASIAAGRAVGVHCLMGRGRTGTFLAAFLVARGLAPAAAIETVRAARPGSIETEAQEAAIAAYARARGRRP